MPSPIPSGPVPPLSPRAECLFQQWRLENFRKTDRMFAWLMLFQWLAGIGAALWISPRAWAGTQSSVHPHVWAAVLLGGLISFLPIVLAWLRPGTTVTRHVIGIGQVMTSALLIHLTGGRIETHFHVFASLVFLSFYRDWRLLVSASTVVALDHVLRGIYFPQSVYGVLASESWRWLEHAGWVGFENFFLIRAILRSDEQSRELASRQAELESTNEIIESTVAERTAELRRSQERLGQSEEKYRLLFEHNPHPMWLLDEQTTRFLAVNDAAIEHYGYSREEFLAMSAADIRPPEDLPLYEAHRRLRGPNPTGLERLPGTWRHRRRDGSLIDVEISRSLIGFPGDTGAQLVLPRDVTETRRAEQALRRSEAQLAEAQHIARIGSWEWDVATQEVRWSKELFRIHGLKPEEGTISHEKHLFHIAPEDREAVLAAMRRSLESLAPFEAEHRLRRADGALRVVHTRGRVTVDDAGRPVRLFGTCQDISERRTADEQQRLTREALEQSQDQLRQAQKMEAIGRLAGGVAHDFNNLMTVISCYSELLLRKLEPESPLSAGLEEIQRATERATELTYRLLAFSRSQVLQPRVVELERIVGEMEPMLRRLIREDVDLVCRARGEAGPIRVDPGQIEQVVMNLLVNARDAIADGGRIVIETGPATAPAAAAAQAEAPLSGPCVVLTVRDDGCGMDAATRARIFEPFFTTKAVGKGTGLGLAMVYGIVKQSGGWIDVDSAPGQGTTFRIYFPVVADPEAEEAGDGPGTGAAAAGSGSETILVVEDEALIRKVVVALLSDLGYTVLQAADGAAGLELGSQHPGRIHLLISDMVMPRMGGRELARRLTALRPEMRVLFISGYAESGADDAGGLEPGMSCIAKPFSPAALGRRIRELLAAPLPVPAA